MQLQNNQVLKFIDREVNTFQMGLWFQRIKFHWLWLELPAHEVLAFFQQVGQWVMTNLWESELPPWYHLVINVVPPGRREGE